MKLRDLTLVSAVGAFVLIGCGGADKVDAQDNVTATDASGMIQDQADRAKDVEIKDKKSLSKNQRIANAYLNGMNDVVIALEKVNDAESAEKAAEVMAKSGEKFDELAKEFDGDGVNREKAVAMVMISRQQEFMAVQQRMMGSIMRIQTQHPELMKTVTDGMKKINTQ